MKKSVAFAATMLASACCYAAEPAPQLTVTLKPAAANPGGMVPALDVTIAMNSLHVAAGASLVQLPIVFSNVQTSALGMDNLTAQDAKGAAIPLSIKDEGTDTPEGVRHWIAGRAVDGAVTVHYRAPITDAPNTRGGAPPLELRSETGGVSGGGATFLALPDTKDPYRVAFKWDFSNLGKGASALSSYGVGDFTLDAGDMHRLTRGFYMGGTIGREPASPSANGFSGAWQGTPPFDPKPLLGWTQHLYDWYFDYFRPGPRPYQVMLRYNPINGGGGTAGPASFFGTFKETTKAENLKFVLAHEMLHTFVTGVDGWFVEGIAVHYEELLPLRAKAATVAEYMKDRNDTASRYYTDALNNTPNSELEKRFWEDTRIRTLPYDRGSLYLDDLDNKVRKASGGKRSLDDLIFATLDMRRRGEAVTLAAWTDLVVKELGVSGKTELEAMLNGAVQIPASDAYGPCFKRVTKRAKRYELGFDPKVLMDPGHIIRGMVAGSNAEKAGLQNGDQITKPVPQDEIQGNQTELQTLEIKRGDKALSITYLPRGEIVDIYQWERVADVPDSACVLPYHTAAANSPPLPTQLQISR